MPPKKPAGAPSKSRELVTTGPKEIIAKRHHGKRDEHGLRPTTTRALILRNGRNGAMGTGELVSGKISGREKLEVLSDDLIQKAQQGALAAPFNSEQALKIAEGQFLAALDDINNLHDVDSFHDIILHEIKARRPEKQYTKKNPDPAKNVEFCARIVAARVHNSYMLASAWRIVGSVLEELADELGGHDEKVKDRLKQDPAFRATYLELWDHVGKLIDAAQNKFALLATTTAHWDQFFKESASAEGNDREYIFDWSNVKAVHKSFLDSIIVELAFPRSTMPRQILLHILNEAVDESPRDAKAFPQALWDAMGDFSMVVQLGELLEFPLLGPEGAAWKSEFVEQRPAPLEAFEQWADAQIFSLEAAKLYPKFQEMIYPLENTTHVAVLSDFWKYVNLNYQSVCGKTIDELWKLVDVQNRRPSWHSQPNANGNGTAKGGDDSDDDLKITPYKGKKGAKAAPKRLTNAPQGYESDDSMPSLQTVSDSTSEDGFSDDDDEYDSEEDDEETDEEAYDEEEEDQMREYLREAMDIVNADLADFSDPHKKAAEFEEMSAGKQDNPFLKLLGSLRGRLVAGNGGLKTTDRSAPRHPYEGPRPPASAYKRSPLNQKPTAPSTPKPKVPPSHKATVEEVSDEDEEPSAAKKKKKKKPKKKKKATKADGTESVASPILESATPAAAANGAPQTPTSPTPASAVPKAATPAAQKSKPQPKPAAKPAAAAGSSALPAWASTATLPTYSETKAQSARTYLQKEGLFGAGEKKKKRTDRPEEKRSIFGKWAKLRMGRGDEEDEEQEEEKEEKPVKKARGLFTSLTNKSKTYLHALLRGNKDEKMGPMKWENFLKVMREMGFTYDPSTAGSSVRFDPPNPSDPSITFHKPHPDPTLYPQLIRDFGKKLRRTYGWDEEDFYKAAAA